MAASKSTGESTKKRGNPQNLKAAWKPGQSGNPNGRKLGLRNRKTVIMEAIRLLAEKRKLTPEDIEDQLHLSALETAMKGSFQHFQAVTDGLYGKITDKVDLTSGGRTLADLITLANGKAKAQRGGNATPKDMG